jgi:hypothetical protein
MKVIWTAIAGICLVAAAVALWGQHLNAAFVIATIGVLAWFLRYRSDLKESLKGTERPVAEDLEVDSSDEN